MEKQKEHGWDDSVVEIVTADLQRAFPGTKGFSPQNIWRMQQLYLLHNQPEFLAQVVGETEKEGQPTSTGENLSQAVREMVSTVPWGHHANARLRVSDPAARLLHLRATARFGWSRNVLLNQIKAGAYERAVTEKKTHHFDFALPEHFAEQPDEMLKSSYNLEFPGLRRAGSGRPGGPIEISRGWSEAEPPDRPTHTFKPRQGRQKYPVQFRFARFCRPCRGSRGLLDGFRGFRSFLAPPPANFFGPSRGRSHVHTKANPIGDAAYALQSKLPGELKGKLPTAKQIADIVRAEMEAGK